MTPIKSFITRDEELQELNDLLKYNRNIVITGPVGVGKSEIVRKYCETFSSEYDRVVWIDGEDFEGNIFALLKDLNILLPDALQSSNGIQNAMSDMYDKLSLESTLLVYDNIEMNETLFKFLPKYGSAYPTIRILMTSQDPRWPSHIQSYPLLPLKLINAFTYLVYNIYDDGSINQKAMKQFLEKVVGRHPLLCQLAAAYVKKHQITVRQYKEILEEGISDLKGNTPPTKDSKFAAPIHAAVNIAISALEKNNRGSTAVHLLKTLSFMDVNNMETKLLRFFKGDKGAYPEQLLAMLEEYALIAARSPVDDSHEVSFSMYSYIRKVLQCNVTEQTTTKCIQDISSMVSNSRTAGTRHLVPLIKKYAHSNDILQILKIHKNTLRLALENDGKYVVAKEVVGCFFMHELKYEFKAGESFMNKYKYGRALEVFEDVLKNQSSHLGDYHHDTMKTKKAIEDCKRRSRILGDDE
jgi:hypothetical protein